MPYEHKSIPAFDDMPRCVQVGAALGEAGHLQQELQQRKAEVQRLLSTRSSRLEGLQVRRSCSTVWFYTGAALLGSICHEHQRHSMIGLKTVDRLQWCANRTWLQAAVAIRKSFGK